MIDRFFRFKILEHFIEIIHRNCLRVGVDVGIGVDVVLAIPYIEK